MTPEIVTAESELREVAQRIARAPRVGLDTEFHNERSYTARLMVVQIAFDDGVVIVDPLALPDLTALADALAETLVVGHALSSDLKIFADRFGRVPQRVFDTQVAASFCGYGASISLADLVRELTGVRLKKSHTVSDWSSRPLSPGQIDYLVDDVIHLLPMHDLLMARLEAAGRDGWALEECRTLADVQRYRTEPKRLYQRVGGSNRMSRRELGILSELAVLREATARRRDIPLKYVMADDVLVALAMLRPAKLQDLEQLRRLDAGSRKSLGPSILEAVARGERIPESELPERPARPLGGRREGLVAVMNVLVGAIAQQNELPPSLLVSRAALERVAREAPRDREALIRTLDLSAWRAGLVAEPLWRLLSGEASLHIEGYANGNPQITTI